MSYIKNIVKTRLYKIIYLKLSIQKSHTPKYITKEVELPQRHTLSTGVS